MTSYPVGNGSGGVSGPDARTANLCPRSLQHSIDGDCSDAIGSLASAYKLAPGTRHILSPNSNGPVVLRPFQWVYQKDALCANGWAPFPGSNHMSCRPLTLLGNPACGAKNDRLYSYST